MRMSKLIPVIVLSSLLLCVPPVVLASPGKALVPDPSVFEPGTDAVLVIDVSGSMKQSDPEYLCRKAALGFIKDLSIAGNSRAALVTFSDSLQSVIPLTDLDSVSDENDIVKELNSLDYTAGDTDIGAAMEKAVSLLTKNEEVEKDDDYGDGDEKAEEENARIRSIFLLTDGEIDLPGREDEEKAEKQSLTRSLMAVEEAKKEGIVIHTVALDLSDSIDENLMNYMADSTGGTSSRVASARALDEVFRNLSDYATRMALEAIETEEELQAEMTEAETEPETEEETETETEAEAEPVLTVRTIGSVDGPVRLSGLIPNLCKAKLNLSDLFCLEGTSSAFSESLRYTAYSDDNSVLSCVVSGDSLILSGLKIGISNVHVIAEPAWTAPYSTSMDQGGGNYAGGIDAYAMDDGSLLQNQASLSFSVQIQALIPSLLYLVLIPACGGLLVIVLWFLKHRQSAPAQLSGCLQWYVRGENEKIFGIPSQTMADLRDYGSRVRLSELIRDDLLYGASLDRVTITALEDGILISSRSASCLIAASGAQPGRSLAMTRSGRFKVFCETESGRAAVIAFYTCGAQYETEPSAMDDSDERTRLLV